MHTYACSETASIERIIMSHKPAWSIYQLIRQAVDEENDVNETYDENSDSTFIKAYYCCLITICDIGWS